MLSTAGFRLAFKAYELDCNDARSSTLQTALLEDSLKGEVFLRHGFAFEIQVVEVGGALVAFIPSVRSPVGMDLSENFERSGRV